MPKLQANLLLVSKFLSNGLKMKFNLDECNIRNLDGKMIVMRLHKGNLYEMNVIKVHEWDGLMPHNH